MFGLKWLIDHGALPKERLEEYYASYVAGIFRTVRFGTAEAHGRAEMMEFNVLSEHGAISRDTGRRNVIDQPPTPHGLPAPGNERPGSGAHRLPDPANTWSSQDLKTPTVRTQ